MRPALLPARPATRPRRLARAPTLALVLLAVAPLALAGCLGSSPGGPEPTDTGTPGPSSSSQGSTGPPQPSPPVVDLLLGFALEGCRGVSVRHVAPIAQVQALLPPGFEAEVMDGTEGLPGGGYGQAVVDLYACGNLTATSARVPDTFYGQVAVPIAPPSDRVPGAPAATYSEYVLRVLAGQDVLANLWPAAGYDTRSGEAALQVAAAPGPVDVGARTAQGAIGDAYRVEASAARAPGAPGAPVVGGFARYTALADGSVLVWTGRYEFPGGLGGQGAFDVPADDPFAGFESLATGRAGTVAVVHEAGSMAAMDLRRVFTPP